MGRIVDFLVAAKSFRGGAKGLGLFKTHYGLFWLPLASADPVVRAIKASRLYDGHVVKRIFELLRPGFVVLDVGANYGQMAVAIDLESRRRFGAPEGATVVAFEAQLEVAEVTIANLALNDSFVNLITEPVWSRSSEVISFDRSHKNVSSRGIKPPEGRSVRESVEQVSIAIDDLHLEQSVSVIKVDIQGADLHCLLGARKLILRDRPAIFFEYESELSNALGHSFQDYVDFIDGIDYVFQWTDGLNYLATARD